MTLGVACAVAIQTMASLVGGWPVFDGLFMGPDSYMRLNRVLECQGGGACPGGLFPRSNAPFGEVLHWPFLEDWLLIGIAAPFRVFMPWRPAVETAGYLLGPLLQVVAVAAVLWATRPLVAGRAWVLAGVFLATQLWVVLAFAPSRPDHHGLQAVFFLMAVAGAIRLLTGTGARTAEVVAGLGMGGGLWVSVEGLVTVTAPLLVLGLRWIAGGESRWARINASVGSWCALVLVLAVFADGPPAGRLAAVYDRVSIVHLTFFIGVALFWWGMVASGAGKSRMARWSWCVAAAALLAGGLSVPFPGLLRGPLVDVDPRIVPIWLDQVAEYVTLVESGLRVLVMGIGSLVFAIPAAWVACRRADADARWGWGLLLGAMTWFGILGVIHGTRWAYYVSLLVPIPYAWLAGAAFARLRASRWTLGRAAGEVGVVTVLAMGVPLGLAVAQVDAPPPDPSGALATACPERELHRVLAPVASGPPGSAMLAPLWWGPEIVFRTGLDVIATPYHRNHEGILASLEVMASGADSEILRRLRERRIEYILVCRGQGWSPVLEPVPAGSLFERLQSGDPPDFLQAVELPGALDERFGLWRFLGPAGE